MLNKIKCDIFDLENYINKIISEKTILEKALSEIIEMNDDEVNIILNKYGITKK